MDALHAKRSAALCGRVYPPPSLAPWRTRVHSAGTLAHSCALAAPHAPRRPPQTSIYLASSPEVEGVTAKYFDTCKPVPSCADSYGKHALRRRHVEGCARLGWLRQCCQPQVWRPRAGQR